MIFLPELNYWCNLRKFEGPINEFNYDFPVALSDKWSTENSVIDLLFNDGFDSTSYIIVFKEIDFSSLGDAALNNRLSTHISSDLHIFVSENAKYESLYSNDNDASNILEITPEEESLLDLLLVFRRTNTVDITSIIYEDLNSSLSKLIYLYLYLKTNKNYDLFNMVLPVANEDRFLELIYEKYVLDAYFREFAKQYLVLDSTTTFTVTQLDSKAEVVTITADMITNKQIILDPKPYDSRDVSVVLSGVLKKLGIDYEITEAGVLNWNGLSLELELVEGSKMFISYSYRLEA